jgi:hypothetical protein
MRADTGSGRAGGAAARWFDGHSADWLRTWRERATARAMSRAAIQAYHDVETSRPELTGVLRYREVVVRQTGLEEHEAQAILDLAEDSFAVWPVERRLIFRDVVQYLVIRHCLQADPQAHGIHSRLISIIADEVPETY